MCRVAYDSLNDYIITNIYCRHVKKCTNKNDNLTKLFL